MVVRGAAAALSASSDGPTGNGPSSALGAEEKVTPMTNNTPKTCTMNGPEMVNGIGPKMGFTKPMHLSSKKL